MKVLKVEVTDQVKINDESNVGTGNVNSIKCEFSLPDSFNGLVPIATFKSQERVFTKAIVNNECYIPNEVLEDAGYVWFGVYAYEQTEEGLILRESPLLSGFTVQKGSYMGEGENESIILPSDFEMYIAAMNKIKEETQKIADEFSAMDVVFDDGDTFQDKLDKGELVGPQGEKGEQGNSGVYVGTEEPTDPNVIVWIDENGEPESIPTRGVDYWTEEDKQEIQNDCKEYIDEQITEAIGGEY